MQNIVYIQSYVQYLADQVVYKQCLQFADAFASAIDKYDVCIGLMGIVIYDMREKV
jgi:hypothetical protein